MSRGAVPSPVTVLTSSAHKDGADSPSSLPHILSPFLLSMVCPRSQSLRLLEVEDLEDHLVQLFSTGNHGLLPSPGTSGNVWRHFWLLQPGGGSGH